MNTVRAAVLREIGSVTIEEVQLDDPGAKEVLIKTAAVGVCHSDLHYIEGLYTTELPVIPGHESAGVVEAVGSEVTYVQPGDHVITCMSVSCGHCKLCSGGRPYLCEAPEAERGVGEPSRISQNGKRMNQLYHLSSYSEKLLVHEKAVVKIRKDMPLDVAALIGCAVITGFGAVTNAADVEIGSTVAVIGCGGIGLSAILGAVAAGASMIVAVDITDEKLETAKAFGATHTVNGARVDPVEAVRQLSGRGVDYAFEALGRVETAEQAFQMLAVGGDAVIIGMVPFGETVAVHGYDLLSEKTLRGSNMGNNRFRVDMPVLVERYVNGQLPLDDMISKRVSLDQINEAFADMKAGTVARSVIVFD
jgi:S-(hydroxymethyl)glutathione dehydrogenase/alcohol dehydrogenase